jgi:HAD superfamily hydrolase (TIGR01549 family)
MKKVIFFDIGHTLATGGEMSPRRLIGYRLGLSESDMRSIGKFIMTTRIETKEEFFAAVESFLRHVDASVLKAAVDDIWEEQKACVELLPGVEDVIKTLADRGYELGVISNIWHPFYEGVRQRGAHVWHYFRYEILSYREGVKKPDPGIYRLARARVQADEYWMVGDTYEMDIMPAKAEGFKTVWFLLRPEREREVLVRILRGELPGPDVAVSDLRELVEIGVFEK